MWPMSSKIKMRLYLGKLDAFILIFDYMVPIYGYRKRPFYCIITLRQAWILIFCLLHVIENQDTSRKVRCILWPSMYSKIKMHLNFPRYILIFDYMGHCSMSILLLAVQVLYSRILPRALLLAIYEIEWFLLCYMCFSSEISCHKSPHLCKITM